MKRKFAGKLALLLGRIAVRLARFARTDDAAREIRVTTSIAGWSPAVAHELIVRGVTPAHAAKLFRDGLERVQ